MRFQSFVAVVVEVGLLSNNPEEVGNVSATDYGSHALNADQF